MNAIMITDATFEQEVIKSDRLTVVDFWAEWCGPCRMLAPTLDEIAKQYENEIKVTKLNVDENPETPMAFRIRSIPTLLFFKGGKLVDQLIGLVPKKELELRVNRSLEVSVQQDS